MIFTSVADLIPTLIVITTYSIVGIAAGFILFLLIPSSASLHPVYGDGLFQDQISASVGERKVGLFIKMTPPVITTETLKKGQKPTIEFRVFNSNNNGTYFHVTYQIIIQKDKETLLNEWFHHHYGDLKLEIIPKNSTSTKIYAQKDPVLDVYTGTSESPVLVEGPIFLDGGLYHFKVKIATLDEDTQVLPDNQQVLYQDSLSVGDIENKTISIRNKPIPVDIISYYDKINNFWFDDKSMQIHFDMPFDWDINRLNKTNIFVHQEITIPTSNDFSSNRSYAATINGIDISKSVMLDNSNPKRDIIHIMLSKNQIIQAADELTKNRHTYSDLIRFVLMPRNNGNKDMQNQMMSHASMAPMSVGSC
jgi:hypothetical protein